MLLILSCNHCYFLKLLLACDEAPFCVPRPASQVRCSVYLRRQLETTPPACSGSQRPLRGVFGHGSRQTPLPLQIHRGRQLEGRSHQANRGGQRGRQQRAGFGRRMGPDRARDNQDWLVGPLGVLSLTWCFSTYLDWLESPSLQSREGFAVVVWRSPALFLQAENYR